MIWTSRISRAKGQAGNDVALDVYTRRDLDQLETSRRQGGTRNVRSRTAPAAPRAEATLPLNVICETVSRNLHLPSLPIFKWPSVTVISVSPAAKVPA